MPERRLPIPEAEAVLALFRAADSLRRHFQRVLAPHDLTLPQYNVLRILRGAGGALPTMEIRERMMEHAPGITRILDGVVAKGLVKRETAARDRRQVLCRLTSSAEALLAEIDPLMDAADRRAFSRIPASRLAGLVRQLRAVERELTGE